MRMHNVVSIVILIIVLITGICFCRIGLTYADSDSFPPYKSTPPLTNYVSGGTFKHIYYISPMGDDANGNGSIGKPWLSFNGATTGGSGIPVAAGDLIYAKGGTYPVNVRAAWKKAYYALERSGTASDYIVITNYPGETPTFTGANGSPSFSIHGNYVLIDGLTFSDGGSFFFNNATYGIVQNSTFGACRDPWADQINGTCVGLTENVNQVIIRNNYFGPSATSHAIKNYTSTSNTHDVKVLYNRFYGLTPSYGVISHKGVVTNWEYAYNKFENCRQGIIYGTTYNQGVHAGFNVHHNAFDNVYERVFERLGVSTGDVRNVTFHDNIFLNATSGTRIFLMLRCTENGCWDSGTQAMGEYYNNAFYDLADVIDSQTTSNFVNYPSYWNFNAYPFASLRNSAENRNSLVLSNWDGSSVIAASHGIKRTGVAGNRFYSIPDSSSFRGKGRYGDTIGGFVWGKAPYLLP